MKVLLAPLLSVSATLLALTAESATPPPSTDTVQVESFTPEGYVKQVRQVTVRFSAPMVALGDPRLEDPFTVDCAASGQASGEASGKGRWADTTNWVFDFDADLDAGVRCRFVLKPGLTSVAGIPVSGRSEFSFHTGGPAILASLPREG
jgi:hypothetical protein